MPAHVWNCKNDFDYCTLTDCKISNGTIVLDNSLTGSVVSDIRDSSFRISDYEEIIPKIDVPTGTSANLYIRSGWYEEYDKECWTDWLLVDEARTRMEYTVSLTNSKIIADFDIGRLKNVYYRNDFRFLSLASQLRTLYLNGIDPEAPYAEDLYSILWSAKVDEAIVGFAKVGHDSTAQTIYAKDAATSGNVVILKNVLPDHSVGLILEYIPRYFVYNDNRNRYFQWKCELTSTADSLSPIIRSVAMNYRLTFHEEMLQAFPGFFRRL